LLGAGEWSNLEELEQQLREKALRSLQEAKLSSSTTGSSRKN